MRHLFLADWFTKLSSGSIAKTVFFRGDLKIGNRPVGPLTLSVPALAVVNAADDVARLDSLKPFIDTMPTRDAQVIEYPGEIGVCLQHLGDIDWPQGARRCGRKSSPGSMRAGESKAITPASGGVPSIETKLRDRYLIKIKAGGQPLQLGFVTVVPRQDWRSTAVKRLRARICLSDEPIYR